MILRILYIHSMMFHRRCWQRAAELLAEQSLMVTFTSQAGALPLLADEGFDLVVAELSVGQGGFAEIISICQEIPHRLGLSAEMESSFTTFDPETYSLFLDYTRAMSVENYGGALLQLVARAGFRVKTTALQEVFSTGIYHPESPQAFTGLDEYLAWHDGLEKGQGMLVGLLFYHGQLVEENLAEIDLLISCLEKEGLRPMAVFSPGVEEGDKPAWLNLMRQARPAAMINFMAGRLLQRRQDSSLLAELDIPVFQGLRSHSQTPDQWLADPVGLPPMTSVFSHNYPEMFGAARPTMVAGCEQDEVEGHSMRTFLPIQERIATLCRRIKTHIRLRQLANRDKRLTIVLHNNPCKGVEATVGMAVGLDSFQSLGRLLARLQGEGYDIGEAPTDGSEILTELLDRKALAEFRWTTVDEIVAGGGALTFMGRDEYGSWFDELDETVQTRVNDNWGEFPGQGMVWQEDGREVLVITGLQYGNIHIINQPKRGCYGAKCTGEVCRILHDPNLAPPHHWLATYRYIQENSDAVIHFGTEGALEYLPGKQSGLSGQCFPEVSLGDLPNFYLYVLDAIGEGLIAKRRGQAMLVDHLTPVFSPAQLDDELLRLDQLLSQHQQAEKSHQKRLEEEMAPLMARLDLEADDKGLGLARRQLAAMHKRLSPEGLHVLALRPGENREGRLLATMLRRAPNDLPGTAEIASWQNGEGSEHELAAANLLALLNDNSPAAEQKNLQRYCQKVRDGLDGCDQEIGALIHGLEGGYILPGLAGSPAAGQVDALPTGRNFFGKDINRLPTKTAWQVGSDLADSLLCRYLDEEDEFPESVGLSIWSSDAFKLDGELFCQILALMGIKPVWDSQGKTVDLEVIALDQLTLDYQHQSRLRPRIDVTMETSGIMRDMVPHFCELLDRAVVLAGSQDEPLERNFIRRHCREQIAEMKEKATEELSEAQMHRLATLRLFSSPPGTYGLGVGLALDASAWNEDKDLAEVYINWGGHAYGDGFQGQVAHDLFARQLSRLDVAYMKQAGEEYDILDCGCYAVSQGGMATATRALSGKKAKLYWHEAGTGSEISDTAEQLQRSAQTRLLNMRWIEEMKKHGYQGAMAVGSRVNNLFKWSATSHAVSKNIFDQVVSTYILNQENRTWLEQENPYALEEVTRRLLEASARELWQADADMLSAVQEAALAIEGDMEERMGEVTEEFQGSQVEVLAADDVDKWQLDYRLTDEYRTPNKE